MTCCLRALHILLYMVYSHHLKVEICAMLHHLCCAAGQRDAFFHEFMKVSIDEADPQDFILLLSPLRHVGGCGSSSMSCSSQTENPNK